MSESRRWQKPPRQPVVLGFEPQKAGCQQNSDYIYLRYTVIRQGHRLVVIATASPAGVQMPPKLDTKVSTPNGHNADAEDYSHPMDVEEVRSALSNTTCACS